MEVAAFAILDPPFGIIKMYSISLKTRIVRGILYIKVNPSMREMNTVENLTQQLSYGHIKLYFFSLKLVTKKPGFH